MMLSVREGLLILHHLSFFLVDQSPSVLDPQRVGSMRESTSRSCFLEAGGGFSQFGFELRDCFLLLQ